MMIKKKNQKYKHIIEDGNILFTPCVFEAMGGISSPANNLLKRLAQDLKMQMKKPYGYILNLLKKTICIGIWKNNIEAIFEKVSDKKKTSQSIHDTNIPDEEHNSQSIFKKPDYAPDEEKKKDFDSDNDVVNDINVPTKTLSGNEFFYMGSFPSVSYPYVPGTLVMYPGTPKHTGAACVNLIQLCVVTDVFLLVVVSVIHGPINLVLVLVDLVTMPSKVLM